MQSCSCSCCCDRIFELANIDQGVAAHDDVERGWVRSQIRAKLSLDKLIVQRALCRFRQHTGGEVHTHKARGKRLKQWSA